MSSFEGGHRRHDVLACSQNGLTLECIQGLILSMVKNGSTTALHSGALAKTTGVSPDTIRQYEKIGALPRALRSEFGYRLDPESAAEGGFVVQRHFVWGSPWQNWLRS
jgi:hypothetical protein